MSLTDYPVNTDTTNPPPRHWVKPFDPDAFKARQRERMGADADTQAERLRRAYADRRRS